MSSSKSTTFEPVHPFNLEDPKTWAETVGSLDWDKTHVCFTKRSLLEFLKQAGVSVDTNYTELQKLPKYASFGTFSSDATEEAVNDLVEAEIADPHSEDASYRPSRKVTQPPGGKSSISFYSAEYEEEDALSLAPPKPAKQATGAVGEKQEKQAKENEDGEFDGVLKHTERLTVSGVTVEEDDDESSDAPAFRTTRKVRENPGGNSTLSGSMFSGYE